MLRPSIRTKLFVLVLVAFSTLIVATSWQIGIQANKVSSQSIARSLQQSSIVVDTKIESRFTSIKETARGLARDGRVFPLVYDGESLTLQDLSIEFKAALNFDVLFFTDQAGVILARSDRPDAIGRTIAGKSPLFDKALAGEDSSGVIMSKGKLIQIIVVPVFDNVASDLVRGSVALGYEFSDELANEIYSLTAGEIGFFTFTRDQDRVINGVQTTYNTDNNLGKDLDKYFATNEENWQDIYQSQQKTFDMQISVNEEDFFSIVRHLGNHDSQPLGFVMTLHSRTALLKPYMDIQRTVVIIGFICLIGASIFAWLFSSRLSRPIIELVAMAKNIQEGDYPDIQQKKISNDEVGVLYNAVVTMGNTLKEKAELENYLAQMSDELDLSESMSLAAEASDIDPNDIGPEHEADALLTPVDKSNLSGDPTVLQSSPFDTSESTTLIQLNSIIDDRYKIIRHIGAGAMGRVFLALDIALDENVAIKIMPKALFNQQESLNFKEEIRLARQITHRNILRTFDFGNWQDYYYITMEYMSGYDLGTLLKSKGAFDTHIGVIMARQICSAMNAAHEQGIIHRDLKPSNMMINRQGILKIMDFGLAMKVNKNQSNTEGESVQSESTTVAGTPRYMAPEQFFNWNLDERSDIYAIGIILFALFEGEPPFKHSDFQELAQMHLTSKPPRIDGKNASFPEHLQKVIDKALAKKPEDRYQSVRSIMDDLHTN